jgi:hypothetical protein
MEMKRLVQDLKGDRYKSRTVNEFRAREELKASLKMLRMRSAEPLLEPAGGAECARIVPLSGPCFASWQGSNCICSRQHA